MFPKLLHIFLAFVAYSPIYLSHANVTTTDGAISDDSKFNALSIGDKMKAVGIIPHVIPTPPLHQARVTFFNGLFSRIYVQARDGDTFPFHQLWRAPAVYWPGEPNEHYTLFMTAVNASKAKGRGKRDPIRLINATQYHSWLYYNVPGEGKGVMAGGVELFPYYQPTKLHKHEYRIYVILIFKQQEKIHVKLRSRKKFIFFDDTEYFDLHRSQFSIKQFAERFKLIELVAGNYFHLEKD